MRLRVFVWVFALVTSLGRLPAQVVSAPRLSGISGGGAVDLNQRVVLAPIFSGATGTAALQYQWRKNGADLANQVTSSFVIEAATPADAGSYTVVVSNSAGASSAATEITVRPGAAPVVTTAPRALTVDVGQSAFFSVTATGSFPRAYQWRKDGANLPGAASAVYSLSAATTADVGAYSVEISNAFGSVVSVAATLTVNAARPPVLSNFSADVGTTVQGYRFTLSAPVASGSTPLTYQWRKDGVPVPGATASTLVVDNIGFGDAGNYSVTVNNVAGTATSQAVRVTVKPAPPPYKIKLRNTSTLVGFSLQLQDTNSLFETQPTSYQWYKDGHPLPQVTGTTLNIASVSNATAGSYFVVASNVVGSTTSETALVTVGTTNGPFDAPWLAAERDADIVYFAFATPARIERFNLATDSWLPTIALARTPTAFTVFSGALYLASGPVISRLALDGTGETSVTAGFLNDISTVRGWGDFLFVGDSNGQLTTVRLRDGAKVSTLPYPVQLYAPLAVAKSTGVIYGRTSPYSGRLTGMKVQADGSLKEIPSTSNLVDLPYGERLFLWPDEQQLAGESGRVFSTAIPDLVGSLGSRFDDLGFGPNGEVVVLRAGLLQVCGTNLYETSRLTTGYVSRRMFIRGGDVFLFNSPDTTGRPAKARVALAQADALASGVPRTPDQLGFTPDSVLLDRDGVVLLFSKLHRQIFRWSTSERRFLSSIALADWPNRIAYSAPNHRIYVLHGDNRISQVKLDTGSTIVEPFVTVPNQPVSFATAGEFLLVDFSDSPYSTVLQMVYDREGRRNYLGGGYSIDYTWNATKRRLYHFRDDSSPNDLLYTEIRTDGTAGKRYDSPYHGEITTAYPIRVSADGAAVVLGSGKVFDGDTLAVINSLPQPVEDVQWMGSRLVTGRTTARGIEIERWSGRNFDLDRSAVLPGRLMGLLMLSDDRVLAVTVVQGLPNFTIFSPELAVLSTDSVGAPDRVANLSARAVGGRGDDVLIAGFVVAGDDPKTVLVRAVGPALADYGVPGTMTDPSFTVLDSAGAVVATNDNWETGNNATLLTAAFTRLGAFGLARNSRDAAVVVTLDPGGYTVQARGVNDGTGVALIEVYDAQDNTGAARLVNSSTRATVGLNDDILIAGFVVQSGRPKTLLIRAVGPTLATSFGVGGALANPRLQITHDGQVVAENDDWDRGGSGESVRAANVKAGAFALADGSRDSALVVTLPAGSYTAQVSGVDGTTGVALVEIYELP